MSSEFRQVMTATFLPTDDEDLHRMKMVIDPGGDLNLRMLLRLFLLQGEMHVLKYDERTNLLEVRSWSGRDVNLRSPRSVLIEDVEPETAEEQGIA